LSLGCRVLFSAHAGFRAASVFFCSDRRRAVRGLLLSESPPRRRVLIFPSETAPRFSVCPDVAKRAPASPILPLLCLDSSTGSRFVVSCLSFAVSGLIFSSVGARTAVAVIWW
jgi:hypothetical protein